MRHVTFRLGLFGVGLILATALAGCGYGVVEQRLPETGATLEGTIKFAGEPVHFAEVRAISDTASAIGRVGDDGRYKIENCPIGSVKLTVDTSSAKGDYTSLTMSGRYKGPKAKAGGGGGGGGLPKFVNVPARYASPDTTDIKTDVSKGSNTYDIVIQK